jgi:hypothetical protein
MDDSTQPTMEPVDPQRAATTPPSSASQPTPAPTSWVHPADTYIDSRVPMPGSVVGAAVVLLVLGVIALLFAGLFLLSGSVYQQISDSSFRGLDPSEVASIRNLGRTFAFGFGFVALAIALCHLAAGVGIFRRATWARVTGMVMAGLGLVFTGLFTVFILSALLGGLPVTNVGNSGLTQEQFEQAMRAGLTVFFVIVGVCLLAYLFTLVALIRNGRVFR